MLMILIQLVKNIDKGFLWNYFECWIFKQRQNLIFMWYGNTSTNFIDKI